MNSRISRNSRCSQCKCTQQASLQDSMETVQDQQTSPVQQENASQKYLEDFQEIGLWLEICWVVALIIFLLATWIAVG